MGAGCELLTKSVTDELLLPPGQATYTLDGGVGALLQSRTKN